MLEILQRLQTSSGAETLVGLINTDETIQSTTQSSSAPPPSATVYHDSSHYSGTVIRHLVIACHMLLLNFYVAVLVALQHDVDLRNGHLEGETQLVMVVQHCAYLLERQNLAASIYFPTSSGSSALLPSTSASSSVRNPEVIHNLEEEIRRRLTRLRETLRI